MWRATRIPKISAVSLTRRRELQKLIYRDALTASSPLLLLREDPPPSTTNSSRRRRLPTASIASLSTAIHSNSLAAEQPHYEQQSVETQQAMKTLVDTLVLTQSLVPSVQPKREPWLLYFAGLGTTATAEPLEWETDTDSSLQQAIQGIHNEQLQDEDSQIDTNAEAESASSDVTSVTDQPSTTGSGRVAAIDPFNKKDIRRREIEISRFVRRRDQQKAMNVFNFCSRTKQADQLDPDIVKALFYLVSGKRPFDAYRILKHYQRITEPATTDICFDSYGGMYERVCDSLRYLDPNKHDAYRIQGVVRAVVTDVQRLNDAGKKRCYPVLVSALVEQKLVQVGRFVPILYQYMLDHDFELTGGYLEHLLSMSKYYRQDDLPYADVLGKAVDMGHRPEPYTVLHVLENLYPYTDMASTGKALKAIVDLLSASGHDDDRRYALDISSLEVIGAAAANAGSVYLNLLIWDLVDLLGYEPTEGIYENTAIAFASSPGTYGNAFAVMAEMETNGLEPSRALVRGLSTRMRYVQCFRFDWQNLHYSKTDRALSLVRKQSLGEVPRLRFRATKGCETRGNPYLNGGIECNHVR